MKIRGSKKVKLIYNFNLYCLTCLIGEHAKIYNSRHVWNLKLIFSLYYFNKKYLVIQLIHSNKYKLL